MKSQESMGKYSLIYYIKRLILPTILCLLTISCTDENELQSYNNGELNHTTIRFAVNSSENHISVSSTRSQTAAECQISEMQILVFEDNVYAYKVQAVILDNSSSTTVFEAPFQSSTSTIKLYFIANMNDFFVDTSLPADASESDIKALTTLPFTSTGITGKLPMFGEYTFTNGIVASNSNVITDIKMLRSVARVDVLKDSGVSNFDLKTVQVFRANNNIQVIPNESVNSAQPVVTVPSIPTGTTATINTDSKSVSGNTFTSQLYLPETIAPAEDNSTTQATCVVVGGLFDSNTEMSYYRIDFQNEQTLGQILRNYHYIFQIKEVNGIGKSTAVDAANNPSAGITTSVQEWDENQTNMIFDNLNHLGYSTQKVSLGFRTGSSAFVDINTNLTDYLLQWSDMNGTLEAGTASTIIENDLFKVEIVDGGNENPEGVSKDSNIRISSKQDNKTDIPRSGYFTIIAGSWNIHIEIEQENSKDQSEYAVNILSAGISYGSFGGIYPERITTGYAAAFKAILQNTDNFGPDGTVPLRRIGFDYTTGTSTIESFRWFLELFDIINVPYSNGLTTDEQGAIKDWLAAKEDRVLFVTRDNTSTNTELITQLCGGTTMWSGGGTMVSKSFSFVGYDTENDYFTKSGPFGEVTPEAGSFSFTPYNTVWLGITPTDPLAEDLIPLLVCNPGNGEYIISVDKSKRVVYLAQSRIYQDYTGGLTNSGIVNTDQSRLIANLWAWAIEEVVLKGRSK